MRQRIHWQTVFAAVFAFVLFYGCRAQPAAPAIAPAAVPQTTTAPATSAPTSEPTTAAEPTTLTVWWISESKEYSDTIRKLFDEYEKANPGTVIKSTFYPYNDILTAAGPAFEAKTPPDLIFTDPAPPALPNYIKAGYVIDLTDLAAEHKWNERLVPGMLDFYTPIHGGKVHGIPFSPSVRGFFYNKKIMDEIGGQVPTTVEELTALAEKAKKAGYAAFGLGNQTYWSSEYYWLNHAYQGLANGDWQAFVQNNMTCKPGVPWDGDAVKNALDQLLAWNKAGYFNTGYQGIDETDVHTEFAKGKMLMYYFNAGSQNGALAADKTPFEIGFFNFPALTKGKPLLSMSDPGALMAIPTDGKHREQVIALMDWLLSPKVGKELAQNGIIPAHRTDFADVKLPVPWMKEELDALSAQTPISWQNWLVPGFGDVTGPEVQKLLAGETTTDKTLALFKDKYEEGCKSKN